MAFTAFNAPPPKAQPTIIKSEPIAAPAPPAAARRIPEFESAFVDRPDLLQRLQHLARTGEGGGSYG